MTNTPQQDLALAAWRHCSVGHTVHLGRIEPDGRIHYMYAGATGDSRAVAECLQTYRSQGRTVLGPRPAAEIIRPAWSIGDEWRFQLGPSSGGRTFRWTVARTDTVGGEVLVVLASGQNEVRYRAANGTLHGWSARGDRADHRAPPWETIVWPLAVGDAWELPMNERRPGGGTVKFVRRCQAEAHETVTVPAGTFRTIRIFCDRKDAALPVYRLWYAPDVRFLVRREGAGVGTLDETWELTSYRLSP